MLNLSLAIYEAIASRKNSQNLMTLLCVTQLRAAPRKYQLDEEIVKK